MFPFLLNSFSRNLAFISLRPLQLLLPYSWSSSHLHKLHCSWLLHSLHYWHILYAASLITPKTQLNRIQHIFQKVVARVAASSSSNPDQILILTLAYDTTSASTRRVSIRQTQTRGGVVTTMCNITPPFQEQHFHCLLFASI